MPEEPTAGEPATGGTVGESDVPARQPRQLRLLLSVAGVVLALDVVTKVLAVKLLPPGQPVSIIGDTVTWTLVRNSGAAFSMATGYTWVLTLIATGVVVGIFWMGRRLVSPWWAVGLGLILGGATGNLVDRFFRAPGPLRGHVVDFYRSAGGPSSMSLIRRWWAAPSCWLCCRFWASTSTPWAGVKPTWTPVSGVRPTEADCRRRRCRAQR